MAGTIDSAGTAQWYAYYPFGEDLGPQSGRWNPFRFAATYRDQESANKYQYYMGARYHDPAYGRFSQVDPLGGRADFGYALNNPVNYADPTGLCGVKVRFAGSWLPTVVLMCNEDELLAKHAKALHARAVTTWPVIVVRQGIVLPAEMPDLMCEEDFHASRQQFREGLMFYPKYLVSHLLFGYKGNPYERQAKRACGIP